VTPDELASLKHRRLLMTSKERIKSRHKLKGIRYPSAQRLAYLRALDSLLAALESELQEHFGLRTDAIHDNWFRRFGELRAKLDLIFSGPRVTWLLTDLAKQIESNTERGFQAQMATVLGVTAFTVSRSERLRELFIHDNTRLIKSLPSELVDKIEAAVIRATRQGSTVRVLEKELREKLALTKQRAQLIARDQVSKYSGELTRHHQAAAGINKYRWETSRDERVRPEHRKLDGQVFSWDKPPVSAKNGGRYHPRAGFNCRCDAIPVIG
jgi:SPP1 gp7 family putative phage head morphogenesis protein